MYVAGYQIFNHTSSRSSRWVDMHAASSYVASLYVYIGSYKLIKLCYRESARVKFGIMHGKFWSDKMGRPGCMYLYPCMVICRLYKLLYIVKPHHE